MIAILRVGVHHNWPGGVLPGELEAELHPSQLDQIAMPQAAPLGGDQVVVDPSSCHAPLVPQQVVSVRLTDKSGVHSFDRRIIQDYS